MGVGVFAMGTYFVTVGYQEYLEKRERAQMVRTEHEIKKIQLKREVLAYNNEVRESEARSGGYIQKIVPLGRFVKK